MNTYMILFNYTDQGIRTVKDGANRLDGLKRRLLHDHLLGTNGLVRDILSRLLYGARRRPGPPRRPASERFTGPRLAPVL